MRTKFARLAPQLIFNPPENLASGLAPARERDFRRRDQLGLVVMQVARDSGPLLVDRRKHSKRKLTDQRTAPRRLAFHHRGRHERSQPFDDLLRAIRRRERVARAERDRAGRERNTYVRTSEDAVFVKLPDVFRDAQVAIAPTRNHDAALETLRNRAA